ncbi:MAG: OadG family transporter subunit [Anaerolineae bacterium]
MSELIWQGLVLSAAGLGLTFSGLGLLIIVMIVLQRFSQGKGRRLVPDEQPAESRSYGSSLAHDTQEEEVVAAIAVALAHLHLLNVAQGRLGAALEAERGPWWSRGLAQQHLHSRRQTGGKR